MKLNNNTKIQPHKELFEGLCCVLGTVSLQISNKGADRILQQRRQH